MSAVFGVLAGTLLLGTPGVQGSLHKDHELGFQIHLPKDWKQIPIAANENWVVAKYLSNRELQAKKDWDTHTPEMKVILFPAEIVKDRGAEATEIKKGEWLVKYKNPYKDFKAYLKENSYGGYYVSKEEETTVNGLKAICLEIKFEKLTVPRRAVAWVFHSPEADWAVQFEVLEDHWEKLAPDFRASLKTFKLFPRTGSLTEGRKGPGDEITFADLLDEGVSAEDRAKRRAALFESEVKRTFDRLPEGWTTKKTKNFVVISHVDEKDTQRMLDQAEAVRAWLDQNFDWVGEGRPGPAILRICRGYEEFRAFVDTSEDSWRLTSFEVKTYHDPDWGHRSWATRGLNFTLMTLWFSDKNHRLSWGMPSWLGMGLGSFLADGTARGGRLEFRPNEWEQQWLKDSIRDGKLMRARSLVMASGEEFSQADDSWLYAGAFVRFLYQGPRTSKSKDFLKNYMAALLGILKAEEEKEKAERKKAEEAGGGKKKEKTEEEEEAEYKERRQREKKRLEEVFARTFGSWSEPDWTSFEKAYEEFID